MGRGEVLWSHNWKYSKCQDLLKFQFCRGEGSLIWNSREGLSGEFGHKFTVHTETCLCITDTTYVETNDVEILIAYIIMYLNLTNQIYPILMILKQSNLLHVSSMSNVTNLLVFLVFPLDLMLILLFLQNGLMQQNAYFEEKVVLASSQMEKPEKLYMEHLLQFVSLIL